MDFTEILYPVLALGGVGLVLGAFLGFASKIFHVDENPKIAEVREVLPGVNCGACGQPGCDGFAKAVAEGRAATNGCPVGGSPVAELVSAIMGVAGGEAVKLSAYIKCVGTAECATKKYDYDGIADCNAAAALSGGGPKSCTFGCLGIGSCAHICPFDAIELVDGIARILPEKCVACGLCVDVCPKNLIELVPFKMGVRVACNSNDNAKIVRSVCSAGCIACKACERVCPHDAIHVVDNLAKVDYDKCTLCEACVAKCPTKVIKNLIKKAEEVA